MELDLIKLSSHLDLSTINVIELIREGIIVTSRSFQPIYWNRKAKEICQQLGDRINLDNVSSFIADIYQNYLAKIESEAKDLIIDYQIDNERVIRIRVNHLSSVVASPINASCSHVFERDRSPWILLFIEDRAAILQDELRIEQKKYGLSDRETEISHLLLQSYSYQDIAQRLQISLNTVKFHVKNINGKKRSCLGSERYCFAI